MSEPLSGWPLSVALAERLGWRDVRLCWKDERWCGNPVVDGVVQFAEHVPAYHESLDALFRDIVPVLREKGWVWSVGDGLSTTAEALLSHEYFSEIVVGADTPAEALCRAALLALKGES